MGDSKRELIALRKMAAIVEKMTARLVIDDVAERARKWPGTAGPDLYVTVGRTRDLMMWLQAAKAARAEAES